MSMRERTGVRDLLYSQWHRPASTQRFLGKVRATQLYAIDIDWCEVCCFCSTPLALIETHESSHGPKPAKITTGLGRMAGVPVFSVAYVASRDRADISEFSVRQLWPTSDLKPIHLTPPDFAGWLEALRIEHYAIRSQSGQQCSQTKEIAS